MGPSMKTSIVCVWFLLFSQGLAWNWPFLSARTPVAEPIPNIIYGACPENGALVCNGPTLFGTCNYGSIVYHSVAEGTVCKDGKIIHKKGANELCPRDGLLVCHGSRMYGYCKSGKVDYQPVTEGVWCQDGRLFGTARQPPPPLPPPQYQPSVVVPYSVLPYTPVNKYLGIPFAASPPVRFSPPQKPDSWSTPIDATAYKPACIQQFMYPEVAYQFSRAIFNTPTPDESEDCLYLNVFAPSTPAPPEGRSVLYWIYGGALEFGYAGNPLYDGSLLAAYQDVIVVTVNYRTNVFGFASSPELPLAERNLGFLDQRMGLDWVQRNIHAFGGNPEKVTLFGESAGGFSIDALLTSYGKNSHPPFRGAILQSGQISYSPQPGLSSVPAWNQLSAAFGCPGTFSSNLTCLRNASAIDIQDYINKNSLKFNFSRDNVTAVSDPTQRRLRGEIARIPVLVGSNSQEGRVFQVGQNSTAATRTFIDQISNGNTTYSDLILAAYPLGTLTPYDQISQIFTEYVFQCPAALYTNDSASTGIPTWRYYFNASFANTQAFPHLGVFHASEIPLVFGTYPRTNVTVQEYALSTTMMGIWSRFAKNPMGGPGWNPVRSGAVGSVLVGADDVGMGGTYIDEVGGTVEGTASLAVLGNRGEVVSSGVTVVDQGEVDFRCGIFLSTYRAVMDVDRGVA